MVMKMEQRSFEIRESDLEKREVLGRAVPFNEDTNIGGGYLERFVQGAVDTTADVKLFRDHKEIIGKVINMEEREDGLWIRAKISQTVLGNETLELVKDGAIRSFSVGFIPLKDEKQNKTIIRTKVDLKEVSLVAFPAYENASVVEVRETNIQEEPIMENTFDASAEIAEVRAYAEEIERRLDVVSAKGDDSVVTPQFRSFGEFVKGVASNDEKALQLHRVFAGGAIADSLSNNAWVKSTVDILNAGRPSFSAFSSAPLPADGMSVEYPVLDTNTMSVTEQAAEGDTLDFGKITLTTDTAAIKTYGGYSSLSRQVIDRSSVAYVDAAFRALAVAYASRTNTAMKAAIAAAEANANTATVATNTFDGWIAAIAEASSESFGLTGLAPEFLLVSTAAFIKIAKVKAGDAPLLGANNMSPNIGSVNPVGLTGSIYGLPIYVDPSLADAKAYVANRAALTTYESAGAPLRLAADDITNLTNEFSVWGYMAIATPQPKALTVLTLPV